MDEIWYSILSVDVFNSITSNCNLCLPSSIRKDSRYSEKDAAVVVRQMLKVAAECHLHGLVHRDMKPEVCSTTLTWLTRKTSSLGSHAASLWFPHCFLSVEFPI